MAVCPPTWRMPERVEDAGQRTLPGGLDGREQVLGALAAESVQSLERLDVEPEDVGRLPDQLALGELHA